MTVTQPAIPDIRKHLFWEFDFERFDFEKSAAIAIERVIERGNRKDWQEMLRFYGKDKVLDVARNSRQLDKRDKNFTEIYVYSDYNNPRL